MGTPIVLRAINNFREFFVLCQSLVDGEYIVNHRSCDQFGYLVD
jgi:hypothetical protein